MAGCLEHAPCGEVRHCTPFWRDPAQERADYCEGACARVAECGGDAIDRDAELHGCMRDCHQLHDVMAGEALHELARCIHETPCDEPGAEVGLGEFCSEGLMCSSPEGQAEQLAASLCAAQVRCSDAPPDAGCEVDPEELAIAGCFAPEAMDHMLRCLVEAPCGEVPHCVPGGQDHGDDPDQPL